MSFCFQGYPFGGTLHFPIGRNGGKFSVRRNCDLIYAVSKKGFYVRAGNLNNNYIIFISCGKEYYPPRLLMLIVQK